MPQHICAVFVQVQAKLAHEMCRSLENSLIFVVSIEVKAKNGTAKSFRTLIASEKYDDSHCGIKLTGGNIGFSDDIYTFPYFCTFLLKRYLAEADL